MTTEFYKIYIVTNSVNLKKYVGQTAQPILRRWQQHRSAAKSKKVLHFHRAINKQGPENFKIEWIASAFTKEDANYLEERWIRELKTHLPESGYNSTYGGEGARHTEVTKAKLAALKLGKPGRVYTLEQREETSRRQKGIPKPKPSEATKNKMSLAHSGENNHLFGVKGSAHPAFGVKHSEESKKIRSVKLSGENNPMFGKKGKENGWFGRTHSEETKLLLSELAAEKTGKKNPFFGKHHSEESRRKMSETKARKKAEKLLALSA